MKVEEFFSWLAVADLQQLPPYETREMLRDLVENIPDQAKYDELAHVLEDLVDELEFHPTRLAGLRDRFAYLLPESQSPLESVEDEIDMIAQDLEEEQFETDRLIRFEKILKGLDSEPDEVREKKLLSQMAELEGEFRAIWRDYLQLTVSESEVTAESVGGHRFLEDAFNNWFHAFGEAKDMALDEAWESACEGNRLLLAVSTWSDQIRCEHTAEIAHG